MTVCVVDPLLPEKFVDPPKLAVIVSLPRGRDDVMIVATPEEFKLAVPITVLPLLKVTVPVGIPVLEVTVAVKVTGDPNVDGFGAEVRAAVAVEALLTV